MALAPQLIARTDGTLWYIFCTDEDSETSDRSGMPPPRLVYAGSHRNYLPGLVALPKGRALALWLDYTRDALLATEVS